MQDLERANLAVIPTIFLQSTGQKVESEAGNVGAAGGLHMQDVQSSMWDISQPGQEQDAQEDCGRRQDPQQ